MSTVTLLAKVKLPVMPNYVELAEIGHATLDEAIAKGNLRVDVGTLDDVALQDFCNEWALAFTRHAKSRRANPAGPAKPPADDSWKETRAICS